MDETIYVILKLLFDFALEVWFSIREIIQTCMLAIDAFISIIGTFELRHEISNNEVCETSKPQMSLRIRAV